MSGSADDTLIEQLHVGIMVLDGTGQVCGVNATARMILNADAVHQAANEERLLARLSRLADRAREEQRSIRARAIATGEGRVVDVYCSPRAADAVLIELMPIEWHERQAAAREARHRDAGLNAMLQGFAHEIRNPLSGMKGAIQLLQRQIDSADGRTCCGVVLNEIERLQRLVERLRVDDIDQAETSVLNIHRLTDRVIALSEGRAGVTFQRDYDPSVPELTGSRDGLIQVLLNLVNNAIDVDATEITVRTRVRIGEANEGDPNRLWAIISVIDNGPGITDGLREILFFPMVSGRPDGSGLGLAIAQRIARSHHGFLRNLACDRGARFDLWLPLQTRSAKPAAKPKDPAALSGGPP